MPAKNRFPAVLTPVLSVHGTQDPDVRIDHAHTLGRNNGGENAVCVTGDITHTLKADGSEDGTGRGQPIVAAIHENQRAEITMNDTAGTIKCAGGKPGQGYPAALVNMRVRRLTPLECERLQGFPDGHTEIPVEKRKQLEADELAYIRQRFPDMPEEDARLLAADGPRYKAIGNSWAVTCARWIGWRIRRQLKAANDNRGGA